MDNFNPWFHQIDRFFSDLSKALNLERAGFPVNVPGMPIDVNLWRKNLLFTGEDEQGRQWIIEVIQEPGVLWAATTDPDTREPRQWVTGDNYGLFHPVHQCQIFRSRNFGFYEDQFRRVANSYLSGEISRREAIEAVNRLHLLNSENPKMQHDESPF